MGSEDEHISQYFEENNSLEDTKTRMVIISCINNWIQIHINVSEMKDQSTEELVQEYNGQTFDHSSQDIIDITKTTRNLTMDEIKQLSIKTMMPEADISQLNWENLGEVRNLQSLEENVKEATEDESYGLSCRRKYEKLSLDQILFIKSLPENTEISIKQLQSDYNISYSVANKIKRSTLNLQDRLGWRKITKVYGSSKEILVKSIKSMSSILRIHLLHKKWQCI